jgi:hypothetical protein
LHSSYAAQVLGQVLHNRCQPGTSAGKLKRATVMAQCGSATQLKHSYNKAQQSQKANDEKVCFQGKRACTLWVVCALYPGLYRMGARQWVCCFSDMTAVFWHSRSTCTAHTWIVQ